MRASIYTLLLLFSPAVAAARPVQQPLGFVLPDVDVRPPPPPPALLAVGDLGAHRLELFDEAVTIDPRTGVASATVAVTVVAGPMGLTSLLLLFDAGLLTARVYDQNGDLPYQEEVFDATRYVQIDLAAPLPAGTRATFYFEYAGTLLCPAIGDYASCDYGGERLDFAFAGTLFAWVYDPFSYESTPYYHRRLELSVPLGIGVYVSSNEISRLETQTQTILEYDLPVRQDIAAYLAIFGDLVERDVPGTSIPTRVIHLASEPEWVDDIVTWTGKIVGFLDEQAGQPFPYPQLNIVKLPGRARFPGTAGPAMSLLSDAYGELSGARYFEETYAHETSHIWWAVLTTDYNINTRFLSEGLATFTQIDYTGTLIDTTLDKETYLGRRYNEMENISLYSVPFADLPPVVPPPHISNDTPYYTEWAYLKGASILELLRVQIGDEEFARGLVSYARACADLPCTTRKFQDAMSAEAREDLSWFFDQYVYGNTAPEISIAFEATANAVSIELTQAGNTINALELWLVLEDGNVQQERVRVERPVTMFEVDTMSRVIGVRPNPRYETMIRFYSAHDLDVDFDAELDGADLVRCAFQVGRRAFDDAIGEGVTLASVSFESRCDKNRSGEVTTLDFDTLLDRFPEVR